MLACLEPSQRRTLDCDNTTVISRRFQILFARTKLPACLRVTNAMDPLKLVIIKWSCSICDLNIVTRNHFATCFVRATPHNFYFCSVEDRSIQSYFRMCSVYLKSFLLNILNSKSMVKTFESTVNKITDVLCRMGLRIINPSRQICILF